MNEVVCIDPSKLIKSKILGISTVKFCDDGSLNAEIFVEESYDMENYIFKKINTISKNFYESDAEYGIVITISNLNNSFKILHGENIK